MLILVCNNDEELLCGHGDIYMTYFCFYNKMIVDMYEFEANAYLSVLLVYQVIENIQQSLIVKKFTRYIGVDTPSMPLHKSTIIFNFMRFNGPMRIYRYTIKTYYGYGLKGIVYFQQVHTSDSVVVDIYDGPFLLRSYTQREIRYYEFTAGFLVRILYKVPSITINSTITMAYRKTQHNCTYHRLTDVGETYNIAVNTMETPKRTSFYYKYIAVTVNDGFIKLTVRNIRTLSGGSYSCEYGGFAISDLWIHHLSVIGPYCTQYGSEPLVNDVRTFYSAKNYLTFFVYSYTFQLDIDISFEATTCEGITNVCDLYCWGIGILKKVTENYTVVKGSNLKTCRLTIIIQRRCIILQRISAGAPSPCWFTILAEGGFMRSTLKTQNFFR